MPFIINEFLRNDEHGQPVTREIEVPDGKWVVSVSTLRIREQRDIKASWDEPDHVEESAYAIVGPKPARYLVKRDRHGQGHFSSHYQLVGEKPFGVILLKKENGVRVGGLWFSCAREIWKGEIGRRPKISRPQFARETPRWDIPETSLKGMPVSARDRRRGKHGWACLTDVAELIGMTPREVVGRYFDFTDAQIPRLHVVFGEREEIHGKRPASLWEFPLENLERLLDSGRTIWIRQGFALTVLHLHNLGYIPDYPKSRPHP